MIPTSPAYNRRPGIVTMGGKPVTLLGPELKAGDVAPDFAVVGNDLKPVRLSDFRGRPVVLLAVPSLDTEICDIETRRFNAEAARLSDELVVLTVSMDLPFAQKRWCGANGIDRVITASDHRDAAFGVAYGVLIEELRLLARSVFVIDRSGIIRYVQLVRELSEEPDYESALKAVAAILAAQSQSAG